MFTDTENKDDTWVASSSSVFGGNRGGTFASGTAKPQGIYSVCVCVCVCVFVCVCLCVCV